MRATVTILEVKEKQKITTKQGQLLTKLGFKAREGDKELRYFTFATRLMDYIKPGETLDIEYDVKEREHDGNIYIDRSVTQVFKDGDLTFTRGQGFRNNTEVQTAVKSITELQIAGLEVPCDLITARDRWLRMTLTTIVGGIEDEPKSTSESTQPATSIIEIPTLGDLMTTCHKQWGMNRTQVLRELGVSDTSCLTGSISLLNAYIQIKKIKENGK